MKKTMAIILSICMFLGAMPVAAVENQSAARQSAEQLVNMDNVTVSGNNDLGVMFSEAIADKQEDLLKTEGTASIIELTIENNQASVSYFTLEDAVLVVALYSEDRLKLLNSAQTQVSADNDVAVLTFEGEMPAFFSVSAYILDTYDYSPLSPVFKTPMYTKEMQDLLASTVDDFDPNLVLNLDEDKTTNFAVLKEETKYVRSQEGVNTVLQADREQGVYRFGNADAQLVDLQSGDVVVYPYEDYKLLIFKVATVVQEADGVVTVTTEKVEIEEVFSHLKIEGTGDTSDATVNMDGINPGITYIDNDQQTPPTRGWDGDVTLKGAMDFAIKPIELEHGITVSGELTFGLSVKLEWYLSKNYQKVGIVFTANASIDAHIEREWEGSGKPGEPVSLELPFTNFSVPVIGGLASVSVIPSLVGSLSASFNLSIPKAEFTFGGYITHDANGFEWVSVSDWDFAPVETNLEGTVFLGFAMKPTVEIIDSFLFAANLQARKGLEIKMTNKLFESDIYGDTYHPCDACFAGEIAVVFDVKTSLEMLNNLFEKGFTLLDISVKFSDFYVCDQHGQSGFGFCPYVYNKITVVTEDTEGTPTPGVLVALGDSSKTTNENGVAEFSVPIAKYWVQADFGDQTRRKHIYANAPQKVRISLADEDESWVFDSLNPENAADYGAAIASGNCGAQGDNIKWTVYDGGVLILSGTGNMIGIRYSNEVPWRDVVSNVTKVIIQEGITYVSIHAFDMSLYPSGKTPAITHVELPSTLQEIGDYAFKNCSQLRSIHLPIGLETIGPGAFEGCSSLLRISVPYTVTDIKWQAFSGCKSLIGINLPDGLTSIDIAAFYNCTSLTEIDIPKSVKYISSSAFQNCKSLSSIELPEGLISISVSAFQGCVSLKELVIPAGITEICESAFYNCNKLSHVVFPENLKTIEKKAFYNCSNLTSIVLPDSVSTLGEQAFSGCQKLKEIILPENGALLLGKGVFSLCTSLSEIVIPAKIGRIEENAFNSCYNLKTITFLGNAPAFGLISNRYIFGGVTATAYYPAGNTTWTAEKKQSYGGRITWTSYESAQLVEESRQAVAEHPGSTEEKTVKKETRQVLTGKVEGAEMKTATFTGLVPGAQYVLLVLANPDANPILGAENLLFIDQKPADENGTAIYQYSLEQTNMVSYVIVCGASGRDLKDAEITVPRITVSQKTQTVNPVVVYNGEPLREGTDYILTGNVNVTQKGSYTCYVRGIHNYTGVVACTYQVVDCIAGDITGDGKINSLDGLLLMRYLNGWNVNIASPDAMDVNGDGKVNSLDGLILMRYLNGWNVTLG